MPLDPQYRWHVSDGVQDRDGRPKVIGVGIENDRVVVDSRGWASLDEDAADVLMLSVEAATAVVRQRKRKR